MHQVPGTEDIGRCHAHALACGGGTHISPDRPTTLEPSPCTHAATSTFQNHVEMTPRSPTLTDMVVAAGLVTAVSTVGALVTATPTWPPFVSTARRLAEVFARL